MSHLLFCPDQGLSLHTRNRPSPGGQAPRSGLLFYQCFRFSQSVGEGARLSSWKVTHMLDVQLPCLIELVPRSPCIATSQQLHQKFFQIQFTFGTLAIAGTTLCTCPARC